MKNIWKLDNNKSKNKWEWNEVKQRNGKIKIRVIISRKIMINQKSKWMKVRIK